MPCTAVSGATCTFACQLSPTSRRMTSCSAEIESGLLPSVTVKASFATTFLLRTEVTVIVVSPRLRPVTKPLDVTVAILRSEEVKVNSAL